MSSKLVQSDMLYNQSFASAGGDSSQDEAEDDVKAITVKTCTHAR